RPSGSFIFLGPSGVGKTELAKTLAEFLFGDENSLIQLDMSEYMEKHTVSRLVGSPPGYVGYEEGGQVTEAVRRKPLSVVLFDDGSGLHGLTQAEVTEIVDLMIKRVVGQLEGQGLGFELTEPAKVLLAKKGYDPTLGARPLRRAIQRLVEDPLSERILWKEFR